MQVVTRDAAPAAGRYGDATVAADIADIDRSARGVRWPFSRLSTYLRRARQRQRAIDRIRPDIVHYHYVNRFTDWMRRPAGTWVLSVHDVKPHQPRLGRLEKVLLRWLYRRPDGLIVHHSWLADQLHEDHGIDKDRIAVVPHQVYPVSEPTSRSRSGRPTVLLFGALRPNKGIQSMIATMSDARLAGFNLVVAGRGEARYQRHIAALAAGVDNVRTELGYVTTERKDELFRQASVVVMPYEAFSSQSGVLHDAYAHGRPVVVTDVGALGSSVREDGTGRVVDVGDRDALVEAIVAMAGPAGDDAATAVRAVAASLAPDRIAEHMELAYRRFRADSAAM